jgi:hypothetical protein
MGNLSGQIVSQIFSLKLKEIFSRIVFAEQHCNRHPKVRLPNGSSCRSFIQPPRRGSGKSGSCYWAGAWRMAPRHSMLEFENLKNP